MVDVHKAVGSHKDAEQSGGETILHRCCAWMERSDLNRLDRGEAERVATDLRMTASDLHALARQGPESTVLLDRRMAVLDLDSDEVLQSEPAVFRDLQRVCTLCGSKRQCSRDVANNPDSAAWKDYCPNVGTLLALGAMPWSSRREW
jgi:hypothetical protein